MFDRAIIRVGVKILIPFVLLFGLYVQFHGDFGPGGGFQAGVIFATGFILYGLIFGIDPLFKQVGPRAIEVIIASGLLIYAGTGVASLLKGGNFLDYSYLAHDAQHGQHLGILFVELGVGITVTGVMIAVFTSFVAREKRSSS